MIYNLNQIAVYWNPTGTDRYGNQGLDTPVEYACRWQNTNDLFTNRTGDTILSQAIIYTLQGETVAVDGYFYLGELTDLTPAEQADPEALDGAYRAGKVQDSPELDGSDGLKKIWLTP